jgi:small subunit ribosomal protein S1
MAEMLDQYLACSQLQRDQIVPGVVVRVSKNEIYVDVNAKCEGIVPERDLERLPAADRAAIRVGDEVTVSIVNPEDASGNIILSLSRAMQAHDWVEARLLLENQQVVEREVVGCNKGGVIVQIGRLRGFVPGSQLGIEHAGARLSPSSGDNRWRGLMGKSLRLKVIEVDQPRNRLILSERAAMREWQQSQRENLLAELTEGEVCRGRVTSVTDFGAFVDLGGIDGLVHVSEMCWKRILHPSEAVQVGQDVKVYVLGVDRDRQRVALSLKRLAPDPWVLVEERYEVGQLVKGLITRLTKWGAFARIVGDEAIEGLVHISELDDRPVSHPSEVLRPEEVVTLRVISVDAARHRLALSLRQAVDASASEEGWEGALAAEQAELQSPIGVALGGAVKPSGDIGASATPGQEVFEEW